MKYLPQENSPTTPLIDDTQWLAMQYVLGELTQEESEQFESAMFEDVALCEAVVAATQLTAGIAMACGLRPASSAPVVFARMPSSISEPIRPAFARTIVVGAAITMALTVLEMVTLQNSPRSGASSAAIDDAAADALAVLLRNETLNDSPNEFDEWNVPDDSISGLVAPEWLLTAVDLDASSESDDHPVVSPDDESGIY